VNPRDRLTGRVARTLRLDTMGVPHHAGFACGDFGLSFHHFGSPYGIDGEPASFSLRIIRPTAPRPVLRMAHKISGHRVRRRVFELLANFLFAPHVEVIESRLPEARQTACAFRKGQAQSPPVARRLCFLRSRETRCFRTFRTMEGAALEHSLMSRGT
jgi:hypothetical protein